MTTAPEGLAGRPVVVGSGIAGLATALHLVPMPVVLRTRAALGEAASSPWAQGGMAVSLGADDGADLHLADTLSAGDGLCEPDAARRILAAGPGAVEDLIRRIAALLPEIRELRPDVIAGKKGLMVDLRVILRSEANIPELTARLQDLTKSKIQSALGIEEQISIRIHIAKIITSEEKDKKRKSQSGAEPMEQQAGLPYGGYGRL